MTAVFCILQHSKITLCENVLSESISLCFCYTEKEENIPKSCQPKNSRFQQVCHDSSVSIFTAPNKGISCYHDLKSQFLVFLLCSSHFAHVIFHDYSKLLCSLKCQDLILQPLVRESSAPNHYTKLLEHFNCFFSHIENNKMVIFIIKKGDLELMRTALKLFLFF